MRNILDGLDKKSLEIIKAIGDLADEKKIKAYLVGGPVRDLFLKCQVKDIDIVVEGDAMKVARAFSGLNLGSKVVTYPAFKTASVHLADGRLIDFVTARKERYVRPGAFPAVTSSNIKDDLFRRDFTVNAMALSINNSSFGELVDPWGGFKDLKAKEIRILHEKSFIDDPTRILRAARFKARLGFTLEAKTSKLLKLAIENGALKTIKPQRYAKDLDKILKEKNKAEALKSLQSWKALQSEEE
jgi:tRNA nucleotidyltransferase (CCA-adding enzyme)